MSRSFNPDEPEWMDVPQPVSPELRDDLANLRKLNGWFGGVSAVLDPLKKILTPAKPWSILDLATGSADIPREVVSWCQRRKIEVEIDAVDFQAATLAIAAEHCEKFPMIRFHESDIRTFAPARQWEIVVCSLALHHFSGDDATQILRRAAGLATHAVIISDLRRSFFGTIGVDLLTAVWMRAPMTRNDARASVRRAFSFSEFADLARQAGWDGFRHMRVPTFRQTIVLLKSP